MKTAMEQISHYPIWVFDGPPVNFAGIPYSTRMTIIRLRDGRLFVHSPIKLTEDLRMKVDTLGNVGMLVAPNKLHHLAIPEWRNAYPSAKVFAAPGLVKRRKDITFDETLGDKAPKDWSNEIEQIVLRGSWALEEVEFFHRESRTLILTDIVQKFDASSLNFLQRMVMKAWNLCAPDGQAPREWRWSFIGNRGKTRAIVNRMLDLNPESVVIAHGTWTRKNGTAYLRNSFRWLL